MNVNIRIWLDVTLGAINVYLASKDDTFLVHYDNQSNLHRVSSLYKDFILVFKVCNLF